MGRRKHMLDGQLRGRNELVADSIFRDTGNRRSRKQVSSHIQVLRNILADQPQLLMHMSKQDLSEERYRHVSSYSNHPRKRHQPYAPGSKYEFSSQGGINLWQGVGNPSSANVLAKVQSGGMGCEAPYTVVNFTMHVHDEHREPVHHYAQLGNTCRQCDLQITDTTSWHKQYPELNFHRMDELKDRQVLVCDSSIKIMTDLPHNTDKLAIDFVLECHANLSVFERLQSRTRFYDSGGFVNQYDDQKPEYQAETGQLYVPFGSQFWAERLYSLGKNLRDARMSEETGLRSKIETRVRHSLQYLTAVQDLYGIMSDTGESHCFLTVLWRFSQTKTANEPGKMMWRVVEFARPHEQRWIKPGELDDAMQASKVLIQHGVAAPKAALYHPGMSSDVGHQSYTQRSTQLDLDTLSAMTLEGMSDFPNPNSAIAPSMTTDYSQQSLPSLLHSQDYHDPNDFDFNGGHVDIAVCLEPAIHYDSHGSLSLTPLNPIGGLHHDVDVNIHDNNFNDNPFGDINMADMPMTNCYSTKPSWPYADLIQRLEGVAEETQGESMMNQTTHGGEIVGHGVLHGHVGHGGGLWKLQQGDYSEDTGSGAVSAAGMQVMLDGVNMKTRQSILETNR
ncbi:hypothetical protein K504DRAFT_462087 [Pleomassaria siparia CBS 279.74]|uniref:TEA domain-containing protein n=1 Tax=Pleomassaria siparia CBS 279.74 TaxID=1314801 RepID=A0A6G1KL60_9PLEO|nr:hypothetical protein K504DRAFT_462087 [Pleomassaria siparia CBS 279.74]